MKGAVWSVLHLVGATLFMVLMIVHAAGAIPPPAPAVVAPALGVRGPAATVADARVPREHRNAGAAAGRDGPATGAILPR